MKKYRFFTFIVLQNKRLLSKLSFVLALLVIPVSVFGINGLLAEQNGIFRIAICAEQNDDAVAAEITDRLMSEETSLVYIKCGTEKEAVEKIKSGDCDAAWIIRDNIEERIRDYCIAEGEAEPFLKIIQREESVSANLSHEKLYGAVFPNVIHATLENYINKNLPELGMSADDINGLFDSTATPGNLVTYQYLENDAQNKKTGFLASPLRGILSILTVLCGLAAQMVYLSDKKSGAFDWLPERKHIFVGAGITLVAIVDAAVAVILSMLISGASVSLARELLCTLCFIPVATAFCVLLGEVFSSQKLLGILIPFIMLSLLLLSPIFFNLYSLYYIEMLFPPYYYLNSFYSMIYLVWALVYSAVAFAVARAMNLLKCK